MSKGRMSSSQLVQTALSVPDRFWHALSHVSDAALCALVQLDVSPFYCNHA